MTPRQRRIRAVNLPAIPTEEQEQNLVAAWLDAHKINWFHTPNGGKRHIGTALKLQRQGVKAGVPDIIVIDPPPLMPGIVGVSIELKRLKGGVVSQDQKKWLEIFAEHNWYSAIAIGADHAIEMLKRLGYGR